MNARMKNSLASGLIAAAAWLGAATPAHAVVYVGNWDPAFGGIFPNLGWKGTATFSLPAACDGLTGLYFNASPGCGGGAMQILSASVSFYNLANPTSTLQTLNFTSPGAVISASVATPISLAFIPGSTLLTGLTSDFSTGVLGTIAESQFSGNSYRFYLRFSGTTSVLAYSNSDASLANCTFTFANREICGLSATSPEVTFRPLTAAIPEPETYALMLLGLAAVGFVALRRKQS